MWVGGGPEMGSSHRSGCIRRLSSYNIGCFSFDMQVHVSRKQLVNEV